MDPAWGREHGWHAKPTGEPGTASWFDDSGATACNNAHYSQGVANRTLPCGTKLRICYVGCETAYVEDRGPFVGGRVLDLNAGAKAAISCGDLCHVRYRVLRH